MDGYSQLIDLLLDVRNLINSPKTDITWSKYNSVEEIWLELDRFKKRINQHDESVFSELEILFAPTGSLQEISIDNGWGNKFVELSSRFNDIISSNFL